jgi:hypothetical protein
MGLMSHQMGGFDDKKIRESFGISDDIHMWSVIAIGHQAALDNLTEEQLERELSPRQRRPLEKAFFMNKWS